MYKTEMLGLAGLRSIGLQRSIDCSLAQNLDICSLDILSGYDMLNRGKVNSGPRKLA
jgi:hypothetical protein